MVRITGGEFRGRALSVPDNRQTRPTQSKIREAIFSSIQAWLSQAAFADLFSGSGVMGLEALSRGARHAVFVESDRKALQALRSNIEALNVVERCRVVSQSLPKSLTAAFLDSPADIVFADPPYHQGWEDRLLSEVNWEQVLSRDGVFCLEWAPERKSSRRALPDRAGILVKIREKPYGDTVVTMFRREE